ncbi:YfbU family protein [Rhodoblastus sp.]|uniref:YfbU family protein n=1 Tax=Rhodoblastus sp. TaxID=1962975 RepID=UPI003F96168A
MKLSDGEKLILVMLADIHEKLGAGGAIDPGFVKDAIVDDHTWGLHWKFTDIPFTEKKDPPEVKEVCEILQMWSILEASYKGLSEHSKSLVQEGAGVKEVRFEGFDLNHEAAHYSVAKFLITKLERFAEFKDHYLNSHSHSLSQHRSRLHRFDAAYDSRRGDLLTAAEIVKIIK